MRNDGDLVEQMGQFARTHPKASIGEIAEEFAFDYDEAEEALREYDKRHSLSASDEQGDTHTN